MGNNCLNYFELRLIRVPVEILYENIYILSK